MDVTAKQISEWARSSIATLSEHPDIGSLTTVYERLANLSGLSASWIAKFYQQAKQNPTQDTLDRLVSAIKALATKQAA